VAKKNPNQNRGIIVTVNKKAYVKLSLPCSRLHRRLLELLDKAKVRSTEYIFTIHDTGKILNSSFPAIKVEARPDTTLEFGVTIMLANGEMFVGNLKAPVKCANDGLTTELARAVLEINKTGWFETDTDKQPVMVKPAPVLSANQKLAKDITELISGLDIEIKGLERDIARLQSRRDDMVKARQDLQTNLEFLKTKPREATELTA